MHEHMSVINTYDNVNDSVNYTSTQCKLYILIISLMDLYADQN